MKAENKKALIIGGIAVLGFSLLGRGGSEDAQFIGGGQGNFTDVTKPSSFLGSDPVSAPTNNFFIEAMDTSIPMTETKKSTSSTPSSFGVVDTSTGQSRLFNSFTDSPSIQSSSSGVPTVNTKSQSYFQPQSFSAPTKKETATSTPTQSVFSKALTPVKSVWNVASAPARKISSAISKKRKKESEEK